MSSSAGGGAERDGWEFQGLAECLDFHSETSAPGMLALSTLGGTTLYPFTILEPRNLPIDEFYGVQKRQSTDVEVLKL